MGWATWGLAVQKKKTTYNSNGSCLFRPVHCSISGTNAKPPAQVLQWCTMMKNQEWKTLSHNVIAPVLRAAVVAVHFAKQSVAVDHPMKPGCVLVSKCYAEPKKLKECATSNYQCFWSTITQFDLAHAALKAQLFWKGTLLYKKTTEATQNNRNCTRKSFPTTKKIHPNIFLESLGIPTCVLSCCSLRCSSCSRCLSCCNCWASRSSAPRSSWRWACSVVMPKRRAPNSWHERLTSARISWKRFLDFGRFAALKKVWKKKHWKKKAERIWQSES